MISVNCARKRTVAALWDSSRATLWAFRESSQARQGGLNYHFTQEAMILVLVSKQARASDTAQVPEGGIRLFPLQCGQSIMWLHGTWRQMTC